MHFWRSIPNRNAWLAGTVFLILLLFLAWRLEMPKPGLDASGPATWARMIFLLILYAHINLVAFSLGQFLLKYLALPLLTKTEFGVLAYLLGFAWLSVGVMILGLVGWLDARTIFFWLVCVSIFAVYGWMGTDRVVWVNQIPRTKSLYVIFLRIVAAISIPLLFVECLLPVWDYDAVLYHLEVPRQFLAQTRFYFDPEVLRSAYPYLGEMLFLVGIAFDLDSFAKFVNFTYALLFVLSGYVFSQRFLGYESAYTTAGILMGAPAFWVWSTWAGIDFAWASYEFWSVYCVSLWLADGKRNTRKWLMLAGILSGLAASTKYLSITSLVLVGTLIAWKTVDGSNRPVKDVVANLWSFGLATGVIAGGWYLKNWVWTGNPVYPLVFGGPGWDSLKNLVLNDYIYSFGVGKNFLDFLFLPYNVYAFQDRFSTIGLEIIHPVLWLAFLFPLLGWSARRHDFIILYTISGFVLWAINSQVIRFLIPLTAFLAILASGVIERFPVLVKNLLRFSLIVGFMLFNLLFQLVWLQEKESWDYLNGTKSASEYLQEMTSNFRVIQYIQESLDAGEHALFLWDGRGYYCDARCIPDDEQSTAVRLAFDSPSPSALAKDLREQEITHLMLSHPDVNWFIAYHDPRELHRLALNYFTNTFFPACGKQIYSDNAMDLFEITCH